MQIFKSKKDLDKYVRKKPLPPHILQEISVSISQVQELINSGFQNMKTCVIFSETEADGNVISQKFGANETTLENTAVISESENGEAKWLKQTYILDDSGDGIVVFRKADSCP